MLLPSGDAMISFSRALYVLRGALEPRGKR
jgi:hypothetical protein